MSAKEKTANEIAWEAFPYLLGAALIGWGCGSCTIGVGLYFIGSDLWYKIDKAKDEILAELRKDKD